MADLVSGHYPQSAALQALTGQAGGALQSNLPVRSNLEWPVFSGALADTAAALTTQVMTAVAIPVDVGVTYSKVSVLVGATTGSTFTNSWAALYSGTTIAAPPLIAQTTDGAGTPAAGTASTRLDFTFTTPVTITAAQAPNGYIFAAVMVKGTVCSLITTPAGAAAGQYRWFANTPLYFSQTSGSGLTSTAPATLANASTLATAPVTFLS